MIKIKGMIKKGNSLQMAQDLSFRYFSINSKLIFWCYFWKLRHQPGVYSCLTIVKIKKGQNQKILICPLLYWRRDLNPHGYYYPLDFKSNVSTNSTTSALCYIISSGAKDGIWTRDPHLGKVMLYPWATFAIFKWTFTIISADANL